MNCVRAAEFFDPTVLIIESWNCLVVDDKEVMNVYRV